ncbi:MAG: 30S ribosomal protein S6, partial [Cetobacterium sp.]
MKKYELMFIINPTILEEGRETVIAKVNTILTNAGATILKSEKWGERKLAY